MLTKISLSKSRSDPTTKDALGEYEKKACYNQASTSH